jgi:hypothetical protein
MASDRRHGGYGRRDARYRGPVASVAAGTMSATILMTAN